MSLMVTRVTDAAGRGAGQRPAWQAWSASVRRPEKLLDQAAHLLQTARRRHEDPTDSNLPDLDWLWTWGKDSRAGGGGHVMKAVGAT